MEVTRLADFELGLYPSGFDQALHGLIANGSLQLPNSVNRGTHYRRLSGRDFCALFTVRFGRFSWSCSLQTH
jgi:hypothetical protein